MKLPLIRSALCCGLFLLTPSLAGAAAPAPAPAPFDCSPSSQAAAKARLAALAAGEQTTWREKLLAGDYFSLRRSKDDKASADKPATILWTSPNGEAKDSYSLDGAVAFKLPFLAGGNPTPCSFGRHASGWSIEPFYEKHRSNLIEKPKDTQHTGIVWNYLLYKALDGTNSYSSLAEHEFSLAIDYKDDRIKAGQGIQYGASYAPLTWPGFFSPNLVHGATGPIPIQWMGSISAQGEHANGLGDTKSGDVYRIKPSISVVAYPFQTPSEAVIELTVDYSGWNNFSRSGPFADYSRYRACPRFCVNGLLAGNCLATRSSDDRREEARCIAGAVG